MPFSLKKKIAKSNRFLAEKFGGAKGTDKGENYRHLTNMIDAYRHYYEDVQRRVVDVLEPNPNTRTRLKASSAVNKLQGTPKVELYPHAERQLADCLLKYSKDVAVQPHFSGALRVSGEAFGQIAEAKNRAVDETRYAFLQPISETLNQDIKEINLLRKKTESRRLDFDAKKHSLDKADLPPDDELEEARRKFEEAQCDSSNAMADFLNGEVEQIDILTNLVQAQLSFYEDASRVLSDLQRQIQTKRKQAQDDTSRIRSPNSGSPSMNNDGASSQLSSPVIQMKPKYDKQLQPTPTCQALYDFKAENPFELSFNEGDVLKLIEQVDDNWYLGELNGQQGHFPINYVQILVPLP